MEVSSSSETSVTDHQPTRRHIQEHFILRNNAAIVWKDASRCVSCISYGDSKGLNIKWEALWVVRLCVYSWLAISSAAFDEWLGDWWMMNWKGRAGSDRDVIEGTFPEYFWRVWENPLAPPRWQLFCGLRSEPAAENTTRPRRVVWYLGTSVSWEALLFRRNLLHASLRSATLWVNAAGWSKALMPVNQTAWRHVPKY
jgi:hypothetical protein